MFNPAISATMLYLTHVYDCSSDCTEVLRSGAPTRTYAILVAAPHPVVVAA